MFSGINDGIIHSQVDCTKQRLKFRQFGSEQPTELLSKFSQAENFSFGRLYPARRFKTLVQSVILRTQTTARPTVLGRYSL